MKLRKLAKHLIYGSRIYNYYLSQVNIVDINNIPIDPWPGDPFLGENILQGNFSLAGEKIFSSEKLIWFAHRQNFYWQNEIHSFSWLRHLKAKSGSLARKHARYLILDWINKFGEWEEEVWEPDILSRRVTSWISNLNFLLAEKDKNFSDLIIKSLLKQIKHLTRLSNKKYFNLLEKEFGIDESSVKIIQIVKGLMISLVSFEKNDKAFKRFIKFLEDEVAKNFNEEGVHSSRSPFVQLCVLADLITIRDSLISTNLEVPDFILSIIKKISHATRFFRNQKGTLVMFNGSKTGEKKVIDKILNAADGKARAKGPKSLYKSGFEKLQKEDVCIFIDTLCGEEKMLSTAPHAIEVLIGKYRLLGSCGTFFGKNRSWKKLIQSSTANSSLTIENISPFLNEDKHQASQSKRYNRDGAEVVELTHYGYYHRFSSICRRTIELGNDGNNIAIMDSIHSERLKNFDIRIHFNPGIKVTLSRDKKSALILISDQGWNFVSNGEGKLTLEQSIFIDDEGTQLNTSQLIISGETTNKKTEVLWGLRRIN